MVVLRWIHVRRSFPFRRCMWCNRIFFNWSFWRLCSIRYGIPEHCSEKCANDECDFCDETMTVGYADNDYRTK